MVYALYVKYLTRQSGMWWYQLLWPADLGNEGDNQQTDSDNVQKKPRNGACL